MGFEKLPQRQFYITMYQSIFVCEQLKKKES